MSIWLIIALLSCVIFGGCCGYLIAYFREKDRADALAKELEKVSAEYNAFIIAAQNSEYSQLCYFPVDDFKEFDGNVCEDEVDLYL